VDSTARLADALAHPAASTSVTRISRDQAFQACEALARSHYENFSVATRLLPARLRDHFYSVYAFCRGVDNLGDEASGDRLAQLDAWEAQLQLCYTGMPTHPYFVALQETIERFDIPQALFLKLIEANRRDQRVKRYPDYAALLEYCDHSANPVGRIVLHLFGHKEPELHRLSDHTCTALQLTNFWQDVARDYAMRRIYLPQSDMAEFGVTEEMVSAKTASPEFKRLMRFEVDRARDLFKMGYPLARSVVRPARIDVALFTAGGLAVLKAIERQGYDVLKTRPVVPKRTRVRLLVSAWARTRLGLAPVTASAFR
jgi:squalene synthase HpnC